MHALLQTFRGFDLGIYYFLSRFAGNWFLNRLARLEEDNNFLKGGVFFAIYWYQWFRVGPDQERRRKASIAIFIGAILAIVLTRTIAFAVPFRSRPMFDPTLAHPSYSIPMDFNLENWSSFPSDTAAYFFALAFGLAYLSRRFAIPIMLYTAGWICFFRMYLGIHYASDMAVGCAIGITTVWVSLRSNLLQSIVVGPALTGMGKKPQWFYAAAFLVSFEMATVFSGLRSLGNAGLHAVLIGAHLRSSPSDLNDPIDVWGGFVVMAALLAIVSYFGLVVYRKCSGMLVLLRGGVTRIRAAWNSHDDGNEVR